MSFPFSAASQLRQQVLLALGASGWLGMSAAIGCGVTSEAPSCDDGKPAARKCLSPSEMDRIAENTCGLVPSPRASCQARSGDEIVRLFDDNHCLIPSQVQDGCCNPASVPGDPQSDGSCCYYHCNPHVCCGRPLLVDGESRLAGVELRADWLAGDAAHASQSRDRLQARIAHEWLTDARMEHASVAAFSRFSLELMAFAAPAELVAEALRAGLDEVGHARMCFSLAERYAGVAHGPGQLELAGLSPAGSLAEAVQRAFLEGCVGETQAALQAEHARHVASDPVARAALAQIAEDEARHALLAWRFVAWALGRDAACLRSLESVAALTLSAAQGAPARECEPEDARAQLHAAGRLTAAERINLAREGFSQVIKPCVDALLAGARSGQLRPESERPPIAEV